jgi:hypothetical protein
MKSDGQDNPAEYIHKTYKYKTISQKLGLPAKNYKNRTKNGRGKGQQEYRI